MHLVTEPVVTASRDETVAFGVAVAALLEAGDVVVLDGELGGGKTAFVSGLVCGLGNSEPVSSPTYAIVHWYDGSPRVAHADLYRIECDAELDDVGFDDVFDGETMVFVEWGSRAPNAIPTDHLGVGFEYGDDGESRRITLTTNGSWNTRSAAVAEVCATFTRRRIR